MRLSAIQELLHQVIFLLPEKRIVAKLEEPLPLCEG